MAERWVAAVNADGTYGRWLYRLTKKTTEVSAIITAAATELTGRVISIVSMSYLSRKHGPVDSRMASLCMPKTGSAEPSDDQGINAGVWVCATAIFQSNVIANVLRTAISRPHDQRDL